MLIKEGFIPAAVVVQEKSQNADNFFFFPFSSVLVTHTDAVKISDFGTSKELSDKSTKMSFAGTVAWMAPEVIRNEPVSEKVDIWWVLVVVKHLHLPFSPLVSQHFLCPFLTLCLSMVWSVVGCSFLVLTGALSFGGLWWKGKWHRCVGWVLTCRFQLRLSADSLCLAGSKCRNCSLGCYPAQSFLPVLCSGPPQQPPQPGWFSITSGPLQGHAGAVRRSLLCSPPPCAACTPGWLLYGQPQDYSTVNPIPDPRGGKPG